MGRREGGGSRFLSPSERPEEDEGGRDGERTSNSIFSELQAAFTARTHPLRQGSDPFRRDEKTLSSHRVHRVLLGALQHPATCMLTEVLLGAVLTPGKSS